MSYYELHREERLAYQKWYNAEHKDDYLKYQRDYYMWVLADKRRRPRAVRPKKEKVSSKAGKEKVVLPVAPSILYEKRIKKEVIVPKQIDLFLVKFD